MKIRVELTCSPDLGDPSRWPGVKTADQACGQLRWAIDTVLRLVGVTGVDIDVHVVGQASAAEKMADELAHARLQLSGIRSVTVPYVEPCENKDCPTCPTDSVLAKRVMFWIDAPGGTLR